MQDERLPHVPDISPTYTAVLSEDARHYSLDVDGELLLTIEFSGDIPLDRKHLIARACSMAFHGYDATSPWVQTSERLPEITTTPPGGNPWRLSPPILFRLGSGAHWLYDEAVVVDNASMAGEVLIGHYVRHEPSGVDYFWSRMPEHADRAWLPRDVTEWMPLPGVTNVYSEEEQREVENG